MSIKSLPAVLSPSLTDREAVADALYRCVGGLDTADSALFNSAFTGDAVFDLNGTIMDGLDAINEQCYASVSKLDTTHFLTNVRINVVDDKAEVTCSALAQHYRPGQGMQAGASRMLAGSLYWVDLVKDGTDGLWKMKYWKLKPTWGEGDWGVVTGK